MRYVAFYRGRGLASFSERQPAVVFSNMERFILGEAVTVGRVRNEIKRRVPFVIPRTWVWTTSTGPSSSCGGGMELNYSFEGPPPIKYVPFDKAQD